MRVLGSFPKRVNVDGARIRFKRRQPRTGGADDTLLGVSGMGDDVTESARACSYYSR